MDVAYRYQCVPRYAAEQEAQAYPIARLLGPANDTEDAGDPLPFPTSTPRSSPEGSALRAETLAAIQVGLETLPVDQRTALVLVDVQGLSYEETATITEANLGTVKSRVNRARGRMRDFLRERDILPSSGLSSGPTIRGTIRACSAFIMCRYAIVLVFALHNIEMLRHE